MTSPRDRKGLSRALVADLRDLAVDLNAGGYTRTTLAMLDHTLRRSVPSTLGFTVGLHARRDPPVEVHFVPRTLQPHEVAARLKIPLEVLSEAFSGSVTFYASQVDAFVVLTEDLAAALQIQPGDSDPDAQPETLSFPISPGISGLHDFSLVNRALGVLLNRGYSLAEARHELRRRADTLGIDVIAGAHAILTREYY